MSQNDDAAIRNAVREVMKKSISDPDFRKLAVSDGTAALKQVGAVKVPSNMTFKFLDNSGSIKTIALPDPVSSADELSELELEQVAGGMTAPCEVASCLNTGHADA